MLILAIGVYSLFFLNVDNPPIVTQSSDITADKSDIRTYHKFVVADDWRLRDLLMKIANSCNDHDKLCVIMNAYFFVKDDIIYNPKLLALSPIQTAKNKEGSVNDKAILFASLLKNANFDIKLTFNEDFIYPVLCDVNNKDIFNAILNWQDKNRVVDKSVTINKGKTYAIWLDNDDIINAKEVRIEHSSTYPIDVIQFEDDSELGHYLKDKTGRYYSDCAVFDEKTAELKCSTPTKTLLAFLSQYDNNKVDIKVKLSGVILSDIKSAKVRDKECIPVDFSNGNPISYPGILNFNSERLKAIGR